MLKTHIEIAQVTKDKIKELAKSEGRTIYFMVNLIVDEYIKKNSKND